MVSLIFTVITIDRKIQNGASDKTIYLNTNGVHLGIVIPKESIDSSLTIGIKREESDNYFSFGWGDENFYLNTPTWEDLTFSNAFRAMFLKSSALMHVTRYKSVGSDWIEIKINEIELDKLNIYILDSFKTDETGVKIILENRGYSSRDDFYKAEGSYSLFKTSNSWANSGFKESGLRSSLWTPFDFGLLNKYR